MSNIWLSKSWNSIYIESSFFPLKYYFKICIFKKNAFATNSFFYHVMNTKADF